MNVLHVYSGNLFGGIETALVALAKYRRACPSLTQEVALCFDGRLGAELRATGIPVHLLPAPRASRPLAVRRARQALARLVTSAGYVAVICHAAWSHACFGRTVRRAGVPLVFWSHDAVTGRHWTERLAARTAPDLIVANSAFTAAAARSVYPGASAAIVACPVDIAATAITRADRASIRADLATSDSAVVIVQASRMEAWKGHAVLIDALATLRDRADWTCWVVGGSQRPHESAYLASLRERARRLGIADRLRWAGHRDDVPRVLAAADIYCQPNVGAEPFGVVFVEALAAGLPCVGAAAGGVLDIVDDSCGRLVPPDDAPALAATLAGLLDDGPLRARLGAAGPAHARRVSDPAQQTRRLHDALHRIAAVSVTHHG